MPNHTNGITDKQKAFVHEYIDNGYNAYKAYITVYNAGDNYQVNRNNACALLKNKLVRDYYNSVIQELQDSNKQEIAKTKNILHKLLEQALEDGDKITALKITDQLNKINGAYTNVLQTNEQKNINITGLDIETLRQLTE